MKPTEVKYITYKNSYKVNHQEKKAYQTNERVTGYVMLENKMIIKG